MPEACRGFEGHQPFRINRYFPPNPKSKKKKDLKKPFFDELNRPVCTMPQGSQLAIYVRDQNFKKRLRHEPPKPS